MFTKTAIIALFASLAAAQDITLIPDCSVRQTPLSPC